MLIPQNSIKLYDTLTLLGIKYISQHQHIHLHCKPKSQQLSKLYYTKHNLASIRNLPNTTINLSYSYAKHGQLMHGRTCTKKLPLLMILLVSKKCHTQLLTYLHIDQSNLNSVKAVRRGIQC